MNRYQLVASSALNAGYSSNENNIVAKSSPKIGGEI